MLTRALISHRCNILPLLLGKILPASLTRIKLGNSIARGFSGMCQLVIPCVVCCCVVHMDL